MKPQDRFDENGWLKDEFLWPLRQQIVLGSLYVSDYENDFGISAKKVCDFFTSFWDSFCDELWNEEGWYERIANEVEKVRETRPTSEELRQMQYSGDNLYLEISQKLFDTEEVLLEWYGCFADECPLSPTYINVDIHWDFARSIQVIASSEDEAAAIVEEMMEHNEIPRSTFEPTGDYDIDTNWQPE